MSIDFSKKGGVFVEEKVCGIVSEYNPFHYGHRYHIQKSKELSSSDYVICIMSGSVVQRGEVAIFDKWQRAKTAVLNGADLVIELPCYYVLQSAENFAFGAVSILDKLGVVNSISFGAETDDLPLLKKLSDIYFENSDQFKNILKSNLALGYSYPKALENTFLKMTDIKDINISTPNNTLGISYLSSLKKLNSKIKPYVIKRDNDYHSSVSNDAFKSASYIRELINNNKAYDVYAPLYDGQPLYDMSNGESYILGTLRNIDPQKIISSPGYENGMENLIIRGAKKSCSLDELYEMCVSKRYTLHRIKRVILSSLLNIKGELTPSYVRVLSFNDNGAKILKEIKKKSSLDIITKAGDYKKENPMFTMDIMSTDFQSLCAVDSTKRQSLKDFTTSPIYVR